MPNILLIYTKNPCRKTISRRDGQWEKKSSGLKSAVGDFEVKNIPNLKELEVFLNGIEKITDLRQLRRLVNAFPYILYGQLSGDKENLQKGRVYTQSVYDKMPKTNASDCIMRSNKHLHNSPCEESFLSLDFDDSDLSREELIEWIRGSHPELSNLSFVHRPSATSEIIEKSTGKCLWGRRHRIYIIVQKSSEKKQIIERLNELMMNFVQGLPEEVQSRYLKKDESGNYRPPIDIALAMPQQGDIVWPTEYDKRYIEQKNTQCNFYQGAYPRLKLSKIIDQLTLKQATGTMSQKAPRTITIRSKISRNISVKSKRSEDPNYHFVLPGAFVLRFKNKGLMTVKDLLKRKNEIAQWPVEDRKLYDPRKHKHDSQAMLKFTSKGVLYVDSFADGTTYYQLSAADEEREIKLVATKPDAVDEVYTLPEHKITAEEIYCKLDNVVEYMVDDSLSRLFMHKFIQAPPGVGKSKAIVGLIKKSLDLQSDKPIILLVYNHDLIKQAYRDLRQELDNNVKILCHYGRGADIPDYMNNKEERDNNPANRFCRLYNEIDPAERKAAENVIDSSFCQAKLGLAGEKVFCKYYSTCLYNKNMAGRNSSKLIITTHSSLFQVSKISSLSSYLIIVDEDALSERGTAIKVDQFEHAPPKSLREDVNTMIEALHAGNVMETGKCAERIKAKIMIIINQVKGLKLPLTTKNPTKNNVMSSMKKINAMLMDGRIPKNYLTILSLVNRVLSVKTNKDVRPYIAAGSTVKSVLFLPSTLQALSGNTVFFAAQFNPFTIDYYYPNAILHSYKIVDGNKLKVAKISNAELTQRTCVQSTHINEMFNILEAMQNMGLFPLIIMPKTVVETMRERGMMTSALEDRITYYGELGLNKFKEFDSAIVYSRVRPNYEDAYKIAAFSFIINDLPIPPSATALGRKKKELNFIANKEERTTETVSYDEFTDPICESITEQSCFQSVERLRSLRGKPNRPIVIYGSPPVNNPSYDSFIPHKELRSPEKLTQSLRRLIA